MPVELSELQSILHSGQLSYGKYGQEFEDRLCKFTGSEHLVTVNSFNSAILVALLTLGIEAGDEIIASPMACLASNQPLLLLGVKIIWSDIDPLTGTLDPDSVRKKLSKRTRAIIHNHFCGYPGYIDEINSLGKEKGIIVIDDAIEAFGSKYKGRMIGNAGADLTIFSFQSVRLPNTIDGGAIVFSDRALFERSKLVRDSGINRGTFRDVIGEINPSSDIAVRGFSATMSEPNSYIGIKVMDQVEDLMAAQLKNASAWTEWLVGNATELAILGYNRDIQPNYWVFGLLSDKKTETIKQFRDMGYYASGVHLNNNNYSVFGKNNNLTGVSEFNGRFVAIPSGWWFRKDK